MTSPASFKGFKFSGPLLDDGAPYSSIGSHELKLMQFYLRTNWNSELDPLSDSISDRSHEQYGSGNHSSDSRPMLGSIIITACLNEETNVKIRHVAIDGSSQWMNGRNVTAKCDIKHSDGNYLKISNDLKISIQNFDLHFYVHPNIFLCKKTGTVPTFEPNCSVLQELSMIQKNSNMARVKKGYRLGSQARLWPCEFEGYESLLDRVKLWNTEVEKYLNRVVSSCSNCAKTYEPKQFRKVSLSSLNRPFNDFICIDHVHIGDIRVCDIMDATTRYSVGYVVPNSAMESAFDVLDSNWISHFWTPTAIQFDQAFYDEMFHDYLKLHGVEPRPISARRHNKNVLESKHKLFEILF